MGTNHIAAYSFLVGAQKGPGFEHVRVTMAENVAPLSAIQIYEETGTYVECALTFLTIN
jgi:hypothetical protein